MMHSSGRMYIDIDGLIDWFVELAEDERNSDAEQLIGRAVAVILDGMKQEALQNPASTITEEEWDKHKGKVH